MSVIRLSVSLYLSSTTSICEPGRRFRFVYNEVDERGSYVTDRDGCRIVQARQVVSKKKKGSHLFFFCFSSNFMEICGRDVACLSHSCDFDGKYLWKCQLKVYFEIMIDGSWRVLVIKIIGFLGFLRLVWEWEFPLLFPFFLFWFKSSELGCYLYLSSLWLVLVTFDLCRLWNS